MTLKIFRPHQLNTAHSRGERRVLVREVEGEEIRDMADSAGWSGVGEAAAAVLPVQMRWVAVARCRGN
jgi:hypothetical protein